MKGPGLRNTDGFSDKAVEGTANMCVCVCGLFVFTCMMLGAAVITSPALISVDNSLY